ncbi:MAG: D-alanyl-D-alanine carboxypeptidase family protein [Leucobacter sp.]
MIRRRLLIWTASGVAAALVVTAGVIGSIRYGELKDAQDLHAAAMDRWESAGGEADRLAELTDSVESLNTTVEAVVAFNEALPEALIGAESQAVIATAVDTGRAELDDADAGAVVQLPRSVEDPEGAAALSAATQSINEAVDARRKQLSEAGKRLEQVATAHDALITAANSARDTVVTKADEQSSTLTHASDATKQAVNEAQTALAEAELSATADAVTALVSALKTASTEHAEGVKAEKAEQAEKQQSAASSGDPSSITVVVNKQRQLTPIDWEPGDLRLPAGISNANGQPVRAEVATALEQMYAAASADGLPFIMISGYRSYSYQVSLFNNFAASDGVAAAETYSARPGHSEHQTGLAVDLDDGAGCALSSCFGETATGQWLRANAYKYGFILRYDQGQQPTVGFIYEPWHFRYVGTGVAGDMRAQGIANLEDYFGLPAAPTY